MNNLVTAIFIGRSGCGKGTQAELLKAFIKERDGREVLHVETGHNFRDFVAGTSFSARRAREIMNAGRLQPSFLAAYMWSGVLIENVTGEEHLLFDGTPRTKPEALILHDALRFYGRERPFIVYMNVSRAWSETRLRERGREDDKNNTEIKERLDWFDAEVMPAVEWYKEHPDYRFLDIHGGQAIDSVHADIVKSVGA